MIKLVYILKKRDDVPAEKFHAYWLKEHGPKVKARQKAIGALKYIQSHTTAPGLNKILQESRGMPGPFDGITEVWWESAATLEAALATAEGQKAMKELLDDESTFIDFKRSHLFMTEEHSIF